MSRPLPDWAKQATPIINQVIASGVEQYNAEMDKINNQGDPSNPETRQTPSPVQEPSGGEKTSERPNAGQDGVLYAESVGCVYVPDPSEANTWRVFQRIDGDSGDAGAVPDDAVPVPNGQMAAWWRRQLRATADRADAAEAKLATLGANLAEAREELEIARLPHEAPYVDPEHQGGNCIDVIMQKIGETLTAERERDEARAKLAEEQAASANLYGRVFTALGVSVADPWSGLAAAAAGVRAERDTWESEYERVRDTKLTDLVDTERERDEARAKLAEIAAALALADNDKAVPYEYLTDTVRAVLRDGTPPAVPVTDREEPAQETARVVRKQPGKYELLYDEDDDSYSIVPVGEKPASAWDVEADTHRISEDHEEPAPDGTDGSLIAEYERNRRVMPPCCRRCWEPERSCRCVEGFWSSATLREPEEPAQHIGRSWGDHPLEDGCPCPQAPCGLVSTDEVSADCPEHPMQRGKTIRQSHSATECPALKTDEENR